METWKRARPVKEELAMNTTYCARTAGHRLVVSHLRVAKRDVVHTPLKQSVTRFMWETKRCKRAVQGQLIQGAHPSLPSIHDLF